MDGARQFLAARLRERAVERVPVTDILLAGNWRDGGTRSVAPFFSSIVRIARATSEALEVRS